MKLKPPESVNAKTSCKDCTFAIYEENTQIGCIAGRIEKFEKDQAVIPAYDKDKEFFVISRLCNIYRPTTWNKEEKDVEKAHTESSVDYDILIDCNNINVDKYDKIMHFMNHMTYHKNKCKIILFHRYDLESGKRKLITSLLKEYQNAQISFYFEMEDFMYNYTAKSQASYHIIVNDNIDEVDSAMQYVNDQINRELIKCILIKYRSLIILSNKACQLIYTGLYSDYDAGIMQVIDDAKRSNLYLEFT